MKRVLAISGGVDSMVLFDYYTKKFPLNELVIAHFDHGTRPSSKTDYLFVEKKCKELNVKFFGKHAKLGEGVSEEKARTARYEFFYSLLGPNDKLVVAHHLDDLVESVAINLLRGTGWRGLAVMNSEKIERPFLRWTKTDVLKYASENGVVFREDPTNSSENYLRNKIRFSVRNLDRKTKEEILRLRNRQVELSATIEKEISEIIIATRIDVGKDKYVFSRDTFFSIEENIAIEILRNSLEEREIFCTRPQLLNFLDAIREYKPGKYFNLPADKLARIDKNTFMI